MLTLVEKEEAVEAAGVIVETTARRWFIHFLSVPSLSLSLSLFVYVSLEADEGSLFVCLFVLLLW